MAILLVEIEEQVLIIYSGNAWVLCSCMKLCMYMFQAPIMFQCYKPVIVCILVLSS